jgi:hypothetical protein
MAAVLLPVLQQASRKARLIASEHKAETFLTDMRAHQYDEAVSLMTPEAQRSLTSAALQKLAKRYEQRYGWLQGWQSTNLHYKFFGSSQLQLDYQLSYEHGQARAIFLFDYSNTPHGLASFDLRSDSGTTHDTSR